MKKQLLRMLAICSLVSVGIASHAQKRYVDDVFSSVLKESNIMYDSNRSVNILYGQVPGQLPIITVNLVCDIYHPDGDTATKRPVIIVAHTGSYLPAIINRQTTGNKNDSAIVELCTRFAKKGYVAVAMNYRQGWNPQTTVQQDATEQLLKATYRALQDMRNCIRFMRVNAGTYGVDTSKIIIGGQGTGGYAALALATIDKRAEIESNLKFLRGDASPMVDMDTLGDWNGSAGIMLAGYPFTFNYGGDPAVSAKAHMVFNYGGAMGDLAWLEASSLPIVSLHVKTDPFAPYNTGNVVVPTTGVTVIPNASGAGDVIPKANLVGVNAKINAVTFTDPISVKAMQLSGNVKNLYPFNTATPLDGAPWEWWDRPTVQAITSVMINGLPIPSSGRAADSISMLTNPDMSVTKARAYIDTIVGFIAPRIAAQFDLAVFTGIKEAESLNNVISLYPNPARTELNVKLPVMISRISVVDIAGKEVMSTTARSTETKVDVSGINPGMYFVNVYAADGRSAVKRVFVQ